MSLVERAIAATERAPLPDAITSAGIRYLVARTQSQLARLPDDTTRRFARDMAAFPVALATDAANQQHYEIPSAFFERILGPHRKYSCGYYASPGATLAEAEAEALARTASNAALSDGQRILELGCGWGSLTLWIAAHFPAAHITAVSNSASQREYILAAAASRGLTNVDVVTADMNTFEPQERYDRIVSVEMFEHMANWRGLLHRVMSWLEPDGRFFMHVFSHKSKPYRFDPADKTDWIAQHFFTGGIMPSHDLIGELADLGEIEQSWRWSGAHYTRTAADWLANYDRNSDEIDQVLAAVYGADAALWKRRWRLFFLATKGLFGHAGGSEWGISHYRLRAPS